MYLVYTQKSAGKRTVDWVVDTLTEAESARANAQKGGARVSHFDGQFDISQKNGAIVLNQSKICRCKICRWYPW